MPNASNIICRRWGEMQNVRKWNANSPSETEKIFGMIVVSVEGTLGRSRRGSRTCITSTLLTAIWNMSTPPSNSQTQQASGAEPSTSSGTTQQRQGQTTEEARKDRTLAEFLLMLDDYEPLVTALVIRVLPLNLQLSLSVSRFRTRLPITTCNASASNAKMSACGSSPLSCPVVCSRSLHLRFR